MANIKISELNALTPPAAADELPVVDVSASSTKKTTVGEVVGIINGDVEVATDGTATISELPVSKLQDGDARQLLQTDAAGTGVEWTSNIDVPGTLDVTGATTLDSTLGVNGQSTLSSAAVSDLTSGRVVLAGASGELEDNAALAFNGTQLDVDGDVVITGDLTVEGASTILETETVKVEDKNIELGVVASPTDTTADGGGITLKGATDKTLNWVNATDAWTSSEPLDLPAGADTAPALFFNGDTNTGLYSPGADQVAISTNGTGRLFVDASGRVIIGAATAAIGNPLEVVGNTVGLAMGIRGRSADNIGAIAFYPNASSTESARIQSNGDSTLIFGTGSSGTERMRLDSSGRLGLGTSVPGTTLTIREDSSDKTFTDDPYPAQNGGIFIDNFDTSGAGTYNGLNLRVSNGSGTQSYGLVAQSTAAGYTPDLHFVARNGPSTSASRMVLDSSGRVGIGTTSPAAQLHVVTSGAGSIRFADGTRGAELGSTGTVCYAGSITAGQDFALYSANTERARIDSSGRLLVGTSSTSTNLRALIQATSANGSGSGNLYLARGEATPADGAGLGYLGFSDSNHGLAAGIEAARDGGTWTSGSSQPSRLVFSVTADGASSPTEAMRIKNTRVINFSNAPVYADNAAAKTGGLIDGDVYRTSTGDLKIVYT